MAFLASSNNGAVSSAMSSAGNSATGTPTHSQELLSLEQQLLASMQQNAPIVSSNTSTEPANNAQSTDPATASYLQQLLAHQMQQQQQQGSQPSSLPISPPAHSAVAQQTLTNDLIQQLASTLLVNPNLAALQPQLAGLQSTAQTSAGSQQQAANHGFTTANPNLAALSGLMSASPTLLPSLLNGGQSVGQTNPLAQYLLNNHTAQSQASQPQSVAALQQQQVLQRLMANGSAAGANGNLLALVQMLQNGNASEIANPNALQVYQQLVAQQAAQQSAVSSNQNHLALLQQIMAGQNSTPTNRLSSMTDMNQINQLASLLQQSQIPSQGDQTPSAYNEFLLRQQHTQHHLSNLSKQNSSNSLLAGLSATGLDSPTASNHPNHSAMPVDSPLAQQNVNNGTAQSASRQASSERLLTSAESVQDHISRLISENEAIVEPNPVLLKRRPYHRQSTSNSITSQTSDLAGCSSQRGSPGLFHQVPNHRLPTTRSQSMHESQMLSSMHCMNAAAGGSLTSGQPVVRQPYGQSTNQPGSSFACNFCNLKFPNDAGLKAHESRCSKREQLTKHQSQPQLQWPLINAQQQQQQLLVLQQQKLLAQQIHQSNIAALVGGGAGVAPDPVINGCSGRSSVPIGAGNGGARCSTMHQIVAEATASPPQTGSKNGTSSPSTSSTGSENRHPLKKRLLESVRNSDAHSATASPTSVTPIASNASSMPNIDMHEAQNSPAKIAKMDRVLGILNKPQQPLDVAQSSLLSIQRSNQTADLNVVHELKAMAEAQRPLSPKIEPKIENEMRDEEMIEFELEVENKSDQRLTETVTAKPRIHSMGKQHEEVEVYVRGRGRGRYICDRCGIRCKKPSMLKKHLKSHTNERPHMCLTCNFAFKTRGNLTKHFGSKAHRSKVASSLEMQKRDGEEGELRIATPEDEAEHRLIKLSELESKFINDQLDDESDNEEDHVEHPPCSQALSYHRFGQENILMERNTHTPPTLWTLCDTEARVFNWPKADDNRPLMRSLSAPPAALCSPIPSGKRRPLFKNNEDAYRFTAPVDLSPSANSDIDVTNGNIESSSTNRVANYVLPLNFSAASVGSSFDGTETPVTASTSGLNEFLAAETKDYACDLCQRKFRKPSDLHVHQLTHQIEQKQNTRARSYPCPECGLVQRSRAVLERHLELSHQVLTSTNDRVNATIEECSSTATASTTVSVTMGDYDRQFQTVSSASTTSLSNSNGSLAANVRKYWCNDCNIGFRTNGVLAKHLRSKNHAKNLTQQGKLPSDTMSLIANQPSLLNNIDATDCETARSSLSIDILNGIREQDQSPADPIQSTKSADESLECTEQIDPESPGPPKTTTEISIGISQKHGSFAKSTPLPIRLSNSHKRRNNDRSHGSPSRQRPRSGSCTIGISTIGQRRLLNSSFKESTWRPLGSQSGPATPRVNFGTRNFYSHMMTQSPVVANVWHPPHVDQLMEAERDRNETTPSNRSAEEMSESTGRSESSTPVHRNGISGGHVLSSGLPTNGTVSPTSTITRCQLCDIEYQSSGEFEIHMFADHVTMRDGKDFRCPKRNCDKVYPNRVSLRAHLHAHFYGGGATPTVDVRDEITTFGFSPSPDSVSMHRNSKSSTANGIVPHHSPGIPEPTHTVTAADSNSREEHNAAVEEQQNRLPPGNIACNMCNSSFVDAVTLQAHWLQDHLAQLNARSHVCTECDAGFTNAEALRIHTENHR